MKELEDMRNDELFTTVVVGIQILRDNERKQGYEDGKAETPFTDTEEAENKAYDRGLLDAWDAAKKIFDMDGGVLVEVFDDYNPYNVTQKYTATEAIAKIKEYEDKQKQDDWRDIPSDEMTLDQARRAVKELRAEALARLRGAE